MFGPNDNFKRLLLALHALTQNVQAFAALRALATVNTFLTLYLFGQNYFGWWRSPFPPALDMALLGLMTALSSLFCGFYCLVACLYFLWRGRSPVIPHQSRSRTFRMALTPILYGLPALWGQVSMMGSDAGPLGGLTVAYATCYYIGIVGLMTAEKFHELRHSEASGAKAQSGTGAARSQKPKPSTKARIRWRWWRLTHPFYLRRMRPLDRSLYVSVVRGDCRSVAAYLSRGADPNLRLIYDLPLLNLAVTRGHAEVVRLLLEVGADVERISPVTRYTALLAAAQYGHLTDARLLLEHGAAVDARSRTGMTSLWLAARQGHTGLLHLLLDHGASVDARNDRGVTALMAAASAGHTEAVRVLLEADADRTIVDAKGRTAMEFARRKDRAEVVAVLEQGSVTSVSREV